MATKPMGMSDAEWAMWQGGANPYAGQQVQTRMVTKFVGPDAIPMQVPQVYDQAAGGWVDATIGDDGSLKSSTNQRTNYGFGIDGAVGGDRVSLGNDWFSTLNSNYTPDGKGGYTAGAAKREDFYDPQESGAHWFLTKALPSIGLAAIGAQSFLPGVDAMGAAVPAGTGPLSWSSLTGQGGTSFDAGGDAGMNPYGGDAGIPAAYDGYGYGNLPSGYNAMSLSPLDSAIPGGVGGTGLGIGATGAGWGALAGTGAAGGAAGGAGGGAFEGAAASGAAGAGLSGLGSALGPIAALAGGLAGSQGTNTSQTAERKMDPRMDAYVYGNGGLLSQAQGLLGQQMPQAQQVGQTLMGMGQGLLNFTPAGNGWGLLGRGR